MYNITSTKHLEAESYSRKEVTFGGEEEIDYEWFKDEINKREVKKWQSHYML